MKSKVDEIIVGDRVFFYEETGTTEPCVGYGMVLELIEMEDSQKYFHEAAQYYSKKYTIAVILRDGSGQVEEQLVTSCLKVEPW